MLWQLVRMQYCISAKFGIIDEIKPIWKHSLQANSQFSSPSSYSLVNICSDLYLRSCYSKQCHQEKAGKTIPEVEHNSTYHIFHQAKLIHKLLIS